MAKRQAKDEVTDDEPMRLVTVAQCAEEHPGLDRMRVQKLISRADSGDPEFIGLRPAIVRLGRSVYLDSVKFRAFLRAHSSAPPAPSRRRA